jgi:DNA invertase Pin-like site-specific DNA recombinase
MLIGYARTSTDDQKAGLAEQERALWTLGCDTVLAEHISSMADVRPNLEEAIRLLGQGDTLVVTKLDRLARSTLGMWQIVQQLEKRGAFLRILSFGGETVDTKGATGRLILTIFAGFAQFEREMMLERQKPGIAQARTEGKYQGRKRNTAATAKYYEARKLRREGMAIREIAKRLEINRNSVAYALGQHEEELV